MTFEAFDKYGHRVLYTYQISCIPVRDLDAMHKAGYRFKLDNKVASIARILELVNSSNITTKQPTASSAEPIYSKHVRCVDTNEIYKNQSAAAKAVGIDPAQVSDSIKTGRPRSGFTFEKVTLAEIQKLGMI